VESGQKRVSPSSLLDIGPAVPVVYSFPRRIPGCVGRSGCLRPGKVTDQGEAWRLVAVLAQPKKGIRTQIDGVFPSSVRSWWARPM